MIKKQKLKKKLNGEKLVNDMTFLLLFSESAHQTTQELGKIIEKNFSSLACVIIVVKMG